MQVFFTTWIFHNREQCLDENKITQFLPVKRISECLGFSRIFWKNNIYTTYLTSISYGTFNVTTRFGCIRQALLNHKCPISGKKFQT